MCFKNCENEKDSGDCKMGSFPEGWICPHERAYCERCGAVYSWYDIDDDGLCEECVADDIKDIVSELEKLRQKYTDLSQQRYSIEIGGIILKLTKKEIETAIENITAWKKEVA